MDKSLGGKLNVLPGVAELCPLKSQPCLVGTTPSYYRLRDLPPHPPCALHRLHPAVQRAPLHGTCSVPQLLPPLSPLLPVGLRCVREASVGWVLADMSLLPLPSPSLSPSQSPCLCFPPGPHGASGHGQHYQLVAVSVAIGCGVSWGQTVSQWLT